LVSHTISDFVVLIYLKLFH